MDTAFQARSSFGFKMEVMTYILGFATTVWSYQQVRAAGKIGIGVCGF